MWYVDGMCSEPGGADDASTVAVPVVDGVRLCRDPTLEDCLATA